MNALSVSLEKNELEVDFSHPVNPLRDIKKMTQSYSDIQEVLNWRSEVRERANREREAKRGSAPQKAKDGGGGVGPPLTKKRTLLGSIKIDGEGKQEEPDGTTDIKMWILMGLLE